MDLNEEFERRVAKINQLKDFIAVYIKKRELIGDLKNLQNQTSKCEHGLAKCVQIVKDFQEVNRERYKQLTEKTQYLQRVMINVMMELDERETVRETRENSLPPAVPEKRVFTEHNANTIKEPTTPLRLIERVSFFFDSVIFVRKLF